MAPGTEAPIYVLHPEAWMVPEPEPWDVDDVTEAQTHVVRQQRADSVMRVGDIVRVMAVDKPTGTRQVFAIKIGTTLSSTPCAPPLQAQAQGWINAWEVMTALTRDQARPPPGQPTAAPPPEAPLQLARPMVIPAAPLREEVRPRCKAGP